MPEVHGGAGMGMVDMAVVLEELGRAVHPGPFASTAVGAVSLVALAGSEDDRAELLPALASGEIDRHRCALRRGGGRPDAVVNDGDWQLDGRRRSHVAGRSRR